MSDRPGRTPRDVAGNLTVYFLFFGGLLALLWFFPLQTLCAIAFLFLLRFPGC